MVGAKLRIHGFWAAVLMIGLGTGCRSAPEVTVENQRFMLQYWRLYLNESPQWEAAKASWLNLGEAERKWLVDLLIGDMRRNTIKPRKDRAGNLKPGWMKPVEELQSLGSLALVPLLLTLAELRDETAVIPCIEALTRIARYEDMEAAFGSPSTGDNISYQCRLTRVLFRLNDQRALDKVLCILEGSLNWQVRATAADVLADYSGPRSGAVQEALNRALQDEDEFVVSKAKKALAAVQQPEASKP